DCGREDNTLPEATRAGIISLSIWVAQFTKDVIRSGGDLEPLIEINKMIMAGLSGRAAEPSPAI
ncbi:MAG: flagellar biosynthesis regulator FlaF, partial [Pseudomonadota bacterium]